MKSGKSLKKVGDKMRLYPEKKEITATFVNLIVAKMFFTYPRVLILNSGTAAWLQMIYITALSFLIFLVIDRLLARTGTKDIFEVAENLGGKIFRVFVGIVTLFIMIISLSSDIRVFCESVGMVLLPNMSTKMIMLVFLATVSIAAGIGINSIFRIHSIVMPLIAVVMLFFVAVLIPDMDINNIFPLAGKGTYNVFIRGSQGIYAFADMMTIYIIMPYVKNRSDATKSVKLAFLISGVVSTVLILIYTLVYPYPVSKAFVIPSYQLAKMANIGFYFQRFEAFFEFSWAVAMLLYASFYLFIISYTFIKTFNLKYQKDVILPIAVFSASIGFITTNIVTFLANKYMFSRVVYPFFYVIMAVVGLVFVIRNRGDSKREQ